MGHKGGVIDLYKQKAAQDLSACLMGSYYGISALGQKGSINDQYYGLVSLGQKGSINDQYYGLAFSDTQGSMKTNY